MVAQQGIFLARHTREIMFAGDGVPLSGQIDYPQKSAPPAGYPLLFILQHAGCNGREDYQHYAEAGLRSGSAVFRWDKRGTGRSGAGGRGSTTQDAVNAYEAALDQPKVNHGRTIILAQGGGTKLLGSAYGLFARLQAPYGVALVGSRLDENAVQAITAPLHIIQGAGDWNSPQQFAETACALHNQHYPYGASFYVADNADHLLIDAQTGRFHDGALASLSDWLTSLCPPSS